MTEPAFPAEYVQSGVVTVKTSGISQRRLLAGMILGHALQGVLVNPPEETPTIETVQTIVKACVVFADELIKQTEET